MLCCDFGSGCEHLVPLQSKWQRSWGTKIQKVKMSKCCHLMQSLPRRRPAFMNDFKASLCFTSVYFVFQHNTRLSIQTVQAKQLWSISERRKVGWDTSHNSPLTPPTPILPSPRRRQRLTNDEVTGWEGQWRTQHSS